MLTGKNAQWGSKPAYQLTSNQMEGKGEGRREGSHRNRNPKGNIRDVDEKRGGAVFVLQQGQKIKKRTSRHYEKEES